MTTPDKRFEQRVVENEGRELTEGVTLEGYQDPTGEYPKREYHFGSGINKAAVGTQINNLKLSGSEIGIDLGLPPQRASEYPFNQVQETTSGHVVELDDTPGGERILIRHRTGAGVELRADGSVIVSATNNKIEVTGGDQTTIIEGNGNLVYKGNLNMTVTGDYNLDVGGNMNVSVGGNKREQINLDMVTEVNRNLSMVTKGSRSTKTIGFNSEIYFDENHEIVKKNKKTTVEGDIETFSGANILTTSEDTLVMSSLVSSLAGHNNISVLGNKGAIGGENVNFTGSVFAGVDGPKPFSTKAEFYGNFQGQAIEAISAQQSFKAKHAKTAVKATKAGSTGAVSGIVAGAGKSLTDKVSDALQPHAVVKPAVVSSHVQSGKYAIRGVIVDEGDTLKNSILLKDIEEEYGNVFPSKPTLAEIRSVFRNEQLRDLLAPVLIAEGRLSAAYNNSVPPSIGRTKVARKEYKQFGKTPIGNAIDGVGKGFKL